MTPSVPGRLRRLSGPLALVVALLALVVAAAGTSYAAGLAKNSVGAKQLKNNAVTAKKVKDGSLTSADFAADTLRTGPVGATGPSGPTGPRGPGAQGLLVTDEVGGSTASLSLGDLGSITLLCSSTQVFTQLNAASGNNLVIGGVASTDASGTAPTRLNANGASAVVVSGENATVSAVQAVVGNLATNAFADLSFVASRTGSTCTLRGTLVRPS